MKIESLFPILACCAVILAGMVCFDRCGHGCSEEYTADTVTSERCDTVHDTVYISRPVVIESRTLDVMEVKFPRWHRPIGAADTSAAERGDSVTVAVAIEQRHYGGEYYDAWVSGYRPQLDSLRIYRPTTTITRTQEITRWRTRRWGLSAGVGVTATYRGVDAGIFVGVSYMFYAF